MMTNVRYEYDALGRGVSRQGKTLSATKYTYDGLDVVMDDDFNNGIVKYQNGLGIDDKLKMVVGGQANYFSQDHLGSTIRLSDQNGGMKAVFSYDSFGEAAGFSFTNTRNRYTGREFDEFTNLYYYRARFYDANLGRFVSEDPIGFVGGDVNLFAYVKNNPQNFADPTGLYPSFSINPSETEFNQSPKANTNECGCNKNNDDVQKMKDIFDSSVYRMTINGQRHVNPYWNNFWSTFGASYIGCGQQADIVTGDLQVGFPQGKWQFQIQTGYTPLYHQWGIATSNNPDDPIVRYDPWNDEFEVRCGCEK